MAQTAEEHNDSVAGVEYGGAEVSERKHTYVAWVPHNVIYVEATSKQSAHSKAVALLRDCPGRLRVITYRTMKRLIRENPPIAKVKEGKP